MFHKTAEGIRFLQDVKTHIRRLEIPVDLVHKVRVKEY